MNFFKHRFQSFVFGFKLPIEASKLIATKKSLMLLSILPILATLALYYYAIGGLQLYLQQYFRDLILGMGWSPDGWLSWTIGIVLQLVLLIVAALSFAFSSSIIASPFNDFLAERTEKHSTLLPADSGNLGNQIKLILIDLGKAVAAGTIGILAILLSWVPILNLFVFVLTFLLITFQYISYPQTRRGIRFWPSARFLWRHLYACTGFGFIITLMFAVPFLSSFFLPLAVVGGTLLFARAEDSTAEFPLC